MLMQSSGTIKPLLSFTARKLGGMGTVGRWTFATVGVSCFLRLIMQRIMRKERLTKCEALGRRVQLKRDEERELQQLISPTGRTITFRYDDDSRIIEAVDDTGNVRKYAYDSSGHLETVMDASRVLYRFEYASLLHDPDYAPIL
jgi:YD repeat-containing protein